MTKKTLDPVTDANDGARKQLVSEYINEYILYNYVGSGSPEGVVTAPVGSIYHRTDGGASTSLYVKESGTGNTGWIAK